MPQEERKTSLGSGVIVSADGLVVTNNHVIEHARQIAMTTADRKRHRVTLVGTDPVTDIAVLRIEGQRPARRCPGATRRSAAVGEYVLAIGNPFQLNQTVTMGIISATGRSNVGIVDYEDFIQTDAAINPGNSGGALVNTRAELIGINTAIYSETGGYQGIGFAVPANLARKVVDQLVANGRVRRGCDRDHAHQRRRRRRRAALGLQAQGVVIVELLRGSPADRAGHRARGRRGGGRRARRRGRRAAPQRAGRAPRSARSCGSPCCARGPAPRDPRPRRGGEHPMPRKELGEILREADLISEAQLARGPPASAHVRRAAGQHPRPAEDPDREVRRDLPRPPARRAARRPLEDRDRPLVLEVLPLELCERHLVFPVRVEGTRLQIAMSDPDRPRPRLRDRVQDRRPPRAHDRPGVEHQERDRRGAARPQGGPEEDLARTCRRPRDTEAGTRPRPPRARGAGAAAPDPAAGRPPSRRRSRREERAIFETLAGAPDRHPGCRPPPTASPPSRRCRRSWPWTTTTRSCG